MEENALLMQCDSASDSLAAQFHEHALLGLAAFATEVQDTHVMLLQKIAQACLKMRRNVSALFYAVTAMRARDMLGHAPPRAAYRAALACWRLGLPSCVPFVLTQVCRARLCAAHM